jgi:hypothetical protein
MRCPCCWSNKAYVRQVTPGKRLLLSCLLLVPLRCQDCYHKFVVLWFSTIGQHTRQPTHSRLDPRHRAVRPTRGEPLQKPGNRI